MNKIIIFGAGKVGRSFIGQLFSRGGYGVVFIDQDKKLVDLLNAEKKYRVIIRNEPDEIIEISHIRAVCSSDSQTVNRELADTDLVALSVGRKNLDAVLPLLGSGIRERYRQYPDRPLDIIIAENLIDGDQYLKRRLKKLLNNEFPVEKYLGLVETSIGKMIPLMTRVDHENDPLQVFAEPYNTLILSKNGFLNQIPQVPGLSPKENMKAWVDRKLFIHNLGHAAAAYFGYLKHPGKPLMHQALADPVVYDFTRDTMQESATILNGKYPDEFTPGALNDHIDDLLTRFMNPCLRDTVFRVGCHLSRKLGRNDRLVYPLREGLRMGFPTERILYALTAGFYFRATDEHGLYLPEDRELFDSWDPDIKNLLVDVSGFNRTNDKALLTSAAGLCKHINATFTPGIKLN